VLLVDLDIFASQEQEESLHGYYRPREESLRIGMKCGNLKIWQHRWMLRMKYRTHHYHHHCWYCWFCCCSILVFS